MAPLLACNLGMCPDWEVNPHPLCLQAGAQSTEPHQSRLNFKMLSPTFSKSFQGSGFIRVSNVIQTGCSGPNSDPLWLWSPFPPFGVLSSSLLGAWGQLDAPEELQVWPLRGCLRDPCAGPRHGRATWWKDLFCWPENIYFAGSITWNWDVRTCWNWVWWLKLFIYTEDSQKYLHWSPHTLGVTLSSRSSFIHSFIQAFNGVHSFKWPAVM